jgi:hypothetical protein
MASRARQSSRRAASSEGRDDREVDDPLADPEGGRGDTPWGGGFQGRL